MIISAREVNTGGGCMVTIINSDTWDYVLVVNDECTATYHSEDDFFDGVDALSFSYIAQ
jgi:hypothetical protein